MCYHTCSDVARRMHAGKPAALTICGAPEITYECALHASQTLFIKNNRLTFSHPEYENHKPECAEKDSHYHAQREHGCFE